MVGTCEVCKHPNDHSPREKDNGIKPPYCEACKWCRERRKSLEAPTPPGFTSYGR